MLKPLDLFDLLCYNSSNKKRQTADAEQDGSFRWMSFRGTNTWKST